MSSVLELARQLFLREIVASVKGSFLGVLWLVLNPILMMGLYVLVFGLLFEGRFGEVENESGIAFAIGVFVGLSVVNLVNDTISASPIVFSKNSNLVKRVVFPLVLLPAAQVAGSVFRFGINALLFAGAAMITGYGGVGMLWIPLFIFPLCLIVFGLALIVSSLSVYFRDISHLTSVFTQVIFWSSGVFFGSARVMEYPAVWNVLRWNPFFVAIENVRGVLLWGQSPDGAQVAYLYVLGVCFLALGWFVFTRLRAGFSELL